MTTFSIGDGTGHVGSKAAAEALIALASDLVDPPSGGFVFEGWDYDSPTVSPAIVNGPGYSEIGMPGYTQYEIPPPTAYPGALIPAAYRAVEAVLSIPTYPMPVQPTYETPIEMEDPGEHSNYTQPPIDYVNEEYVTIPDAPTLGGLTFYEPKMPERPTFLELSPIGDPHVFEKMPLFSEDVPEYDGPTEFEVLPVPEYLPFTEGEGFADTLASAALGEEHKLDAGTINAMADLKTIGLNEMEAIAEGEFFAKSAAAGFSYPSPSIFVGMMKVLTENRATRQKATWEAVKEAINLSFRKMNNGALEGIMTLEQASIENYSKYLARVTKARKLDVQMAAALFDTIVSAFNVKITILDDFIADYTAHSRMIRGSASVLSDQARAIDQRSGSEQAKVTAYSAQFESVKALAEAEKLKVEQSILPADAYGAALQAVIANVEIARGNIQSYGDAVAAYAKAVEGQAGLADTYSAEVDAAISGIGVHGENVAAAEDYGRTAATVVQAQTGGISGWSSTLDALIGEYKEYSQSQRSYLQALVGTLNADMSQNDEYMRGVSGVMGNASNWNRASVETTGAANSYRMALAESVTRQQSLQNQADAINARIEAGFLGAKAAAASAMAQAAYGVTSGTMRVSGAVGSQNNTSDRWGSSYQETGYRGYSLKRHASQKNQ